MSTDPVQLLDRLKAPPGWNDPIDLETDTVAAQLLQRIFAEADGVISLDIARRRRRRGVAAAVTVTAIVAGGAVAALWTRSPQESRRIACWSESVDPPAERLSLPWDGVTDPAVLCAAQWSAGRLGQTAVVPDLRVCATAEGVAAAVPGGDGVCASLGFADFAPALDDPAIALLQAQAELDRRFNSTTCQPAELAAAATEPVLDRYGLSGWAVSIAGAFSADEPCASVALDPELATATVRPVPRQG